MHCTSKQKENLFYFFFYFISFHFIVLYFILFYFILFHFTLYYFILFYFIYSLTIKLKGYQILMCGIIHLVIATRDMFNLSLFFALPTSSSTCQYELTQKSYAFTSVARMTLVQPFWNWLKVNKPWLRGLGRLVSLPC